MSLEQIAAILNNITLRCEDQMDDDILQNSFYDNGITKRLLTKNSQLISGRRGTGKTHILRVLSNQIETIENKKSHACYIDCKTFGSVNEFLSADLPLKDKCTHFFRDFLEKVYDGLHSYMCKSDIDSSVCFEQLNVLSSAIEQSDKVMKEAKLQYGETQGSVHEKNTFLGITAKMPRLVRKNINKKAEENHKSAEVSVTIEENIVFPSVSSAMESILKSLNCRLYLLIDEWSSIPSEMQPYIAEFLRRSIIVCSSITVKIAIIKNESNLLFNDGSKRLG